MRRDKRRWLARILIKASYWRQWRTPGSAVWLATPAIARPGVVFTPEQRAMIRAMVEADERRQ
jgi:hypothetical protein